MSNTIDEKHLRAAWHEINKMTETINDVKSPITGDIYHRIRNSLNQHAEGKAWAATNIQYCCGYVHGVRACGWRDNPVVEAAYRATEIISRIIFNADYYADKPIDSNL